MEECSLGGLVSLATEGSRDMLAWDLEKELRALVPRAWG